MILEYCYRTVHIHVWPDSQPCSPYGCLHVYEDGIEVALPLPKRWGVVFFLAVNKDVIS